MSKFINDNKNKIILGTGIILLIGIGTGTYYLNRHRKNLTEENQSSMILEYTLAKSILTGSEKGIVNLTSVNDNSIKSFDLKTLLSESIPINEKPKVEPEHKKKVERKCIQTEKQETDMFEGFEKIEVPFNKGDTAWKIQQMLTPNENINSMIELVRQVNSERNIDYVLPGETRLFLKKSDNVIQKEPKEECEEIVEDINNNSIDVEANNEENKDEIEKDSKRDLSQVTFFYTKSLDFQTLYAYTNFEHSFFKIEVVDGEIEAQKIATINDINFEVSDFKVDDNKIYVKTDKKIYCINEEDNKIKEISLKGERVNDWTVFNSDIFYTSNDELCKIDGNSFTESSIVLGDESSKIQVVDGSLYILNEFASNNYKSVVQKINPKDLSAYGWKELNTNENVLYDVAEDNETIVLAQHKKENTRENNYLVNIDKDEVKKSKDIKINNKYEHALVKDNVIYQKDEDKLTYYTTDKFNNVGSMSIENSSIFVPIIEK